MSAHNILEPTLKDILHVITPLREDWDTRFQVIDELRFIVASVESLRGATVEPFGSFVSNLFTRWGDLDISIELHNDSHISSAGKRRKQTLLRDLLKALRNRGGWCKLQCIPNARVPILKSESSIRSISCDISINNMQGQMKSKILFWINDIDGRFRDMVLLVKEWAKAHDINNPKGGTFNSYSLSLLILFHFQTCVPPIFPPLKEIYPGNITDALSGAKADAERRIAETCSCNIRRFKLETSRPINRSSLSELFISFLAKFSDISRKASELGICPFTGQWEEIKSNTRWLPKTHPIFIEDPFEQSENCARAVNARELTRISEVFYTTHRSLISPRQNQNSILAALARSQTSQFVARMPVRNRSQFVERTPVRNPSYSPVMNPGNNGGHNLTSRPRVHRAMNTPSQAQHRFQNRRVESSSHTNSTMQRARAAAAAQPRPSQGYSQGQQTWRPRYDA